MSLRKRTARINSEYWLVVSEEEPGEWTVQVWGPVPFRHAGVLPSSDEAEAAAVDIASKHFREHGLPVDVPPRLKWTLAMAHS